MLKKMLAVLLVIVMSFSMIIMTGCGDDSYDDQDVDTNDETEWQTDDTYDGGGTTQDDYDDWDTDDNGEADWRDVDTDDDGNVSQDEMEDYVDDWATEEGDY